MNINELWSKKVAYSPISLCFLNNWYVCILAVEQAATPVAPQVKEPKILDIEDTLGDGLEQKKAERALDKVRGFMKYPRETSIYRYVT